MIQSLSDAIEKTDDDDTLAVYSYRQCDNTSPSEIKFCRGVVVDKVTNTPLFRPLGYTTELTEEEWRASPITSDEFSMIRWFPAEEGTLLRMFYSPANARWYLSTHRKLNSFRSRWSAGKPFGEMFETALFRQTGMDMSTLSTRLSPQNVYLFLVLSSPETRVVCTGSATPTIIHVGTLVNGQIFDLDVVCAVERATQLTFSSPQEVAETVKAIQPSQRQGLIGFYPNGCSVKVVNTSYQFFSRVRGNEPSVAFRYLQVRSHPVYSKAMQELYPEHTPRFVQYENAILKIAKRIHNSYIARFIQKRQAVVSHEEYRIVRECHGWHIADRTANRVTLAVIMDCMSQPKFASTVNSIIRADLKPKPDPKESKKESDEHSMDPKEDPKEDTKEDEMTE